MKAHQVCDYTHWSTISGLFYYHWVEPYLFDARYFIRTVF